MTNETPTTASAPKGLASRLLGVIFSPRATYAEIVAHPRVLGALAVVIIVIAATTYAFLSTEIGQRATVDQQISFMQSMGMNVTDQVVNNIEGRAAQGKYFSAVSIVVFVPVVMALMAGLLIGFFNAVMGGEATFKQVYAVVVHSGVIGALQTLFVTPLNYAKESMTSSTSLAVFLPMVDDTGFFGMVLGSIDLFRIWSTLSLAIGLAVLYKKRTAPVAWSLLAIYGIIVLIIAGVRAALSGA